MPSRGASIDNAKRLQILDDIIVQEKLGRKVNFTAIGKKFDVDRTTVARISKSRENLQDVTTRGKLTQKRKRPFKEEDVDAALEMWIKSKLEQDARLNLPILKTKATELARELGHDFVPSDSWLNRFKDRHNLKFKREYGEKQNMDLEAANEFRTYNLPHLLENYDHNNIFNADETGLYFKGLPDRGYCSADEKLCGGKKARERITVLVCSNMTGTEKRKLLVIGKSQKPRCFPKDQTKLPVTYRNSTNAWMTRAIFEEHLEQWNRSLRCQNRQILLLLDNCSAHPQGLQFSHIKIQFLPPNTTSEIQPMDMGVIKTLKGHYRKLVNRRIIAQLDSDQTKKAVDAIKQITLCDALHMLNEAWNEVKESTLKNCFSKAGFKSKDNALEEDEVEDEEMPPPDNMTAEEFEELINLDSDLEIAGTLSDAEIVAATQKRKMSEESEDEGEMEASAPKEPSSQQLMESLNHLRYYLQKDGDDKMIFYITEIEKKIQQDSSEKKKQSKISSFFR